MGIKMGIKRPWILSSDDADGTGDADIEEKKGTLVSYSNVHLWLDTCK